MAMADIVFPKDQGTRCRFPWWHYVLLFGWSSLCWESL